MIRYKKLGYVELNVTDLERSRWFYEDMVGLGHGGTLPDGAGSLRCGTDPCRVLLHGAAAAGFKRVGWMLEDERQCDVLHRRLGDADVGWETVANAECRDRRLSRISRIAQPNIGTTFELYLPGEADLPFVPTLAKIQRIGHVVFATPNFDAALGFFRDVLNFRQSDAIGDNVAFFRCFRNPYHNGLGLFRGVDNSFNHINLMVTEIDDVGRAFNRMRRNDVTIVNGPGRHVASGSIFLYYLDPDGMTVECFFVFQQSPCTFYDVSFLPHTAHQLTVC